MTNDRERASHCLSPGAGTQGADGIGLSVGEVEVTQYNSPSFLKAEASEFKVPWGGN